LNESEISFFAFITTISVLQLLHPTPPSIEAELAAMPPKQNDQRTFNFASIKPGEGASLEAGLMRLRKAIKASFAGRLRTIKARPAYTEMNEDEQWATCWRHNQMRDQELAIAEADCREAWDAFLQPTTVAANDGPRPSVNAEKGKEKAVEGGAAQKRVRFVEFDDADEDKGNESERESVPRQSVNADTDKEMASEVVVAEEAMATVVLFLGVARNGNGDDGDGKDDDDGRDDGNGGDDNILETVPRQLVTAEKGKEKEKEATAVDDDDGDDGGDDSEDDGGVIGYKEDGGVVGYEGDSDEDVELRQSITTGVKRIRDEDSESESSTSVMSIESDLPSGVSDDDDVLLADEDAYNDSAGSEEHGDEEMDIDIHESTTFSGFGAARIDEMLPQWYKDAIKADPHRHKKTSFFESKLLKKKIRKKLKMEDKPSI
jgi:hypothetical protein